MNNDEIFESLLDRIDATDVTGYAAETLASQKDVDENLDTAEPTIDNYDYVVHICTINVSNGWNTTVDEAVARVREYTTEVIFRLEEFLATSPKVHRHSRLHFFRRPNEYQIPDDIGAMVTCPRSYAPGASDHLEIVFGLDYNIRKPRDLFMLTAMLHKFAWGSSYYVEYEGNVIAARDKKCMIEDVIPVYNMMMRENGVEKWKETDSYVKSVESLVESAFQFFGESVIRCEDVRKMFGYDPADDLVTAALSYQSYGSSRKCDIPKFLAAALETSTIDADYLCNCQDVTFRITSATKRDSVQISSWRLKFIWEHVEKTLKQNPRKITHYIMRIYDRSYIRFAFYLGLFQGVYQEDLDFNLKTTVNDVCVVVDMRWDRNELWDTLAGILGVKDGFPIEDVVKFQKKLDKQIYGRS